MITISRVALIPWLFLLWGSANGFSGELTFADQKGKIIETGNDYIIRLIDTPGSPIKTTDALFLVKAAPETCFRVIRDFDAYPKFMPNIIDTKRIRQTPESEIYEFTLKVALVKVKYTLALQSREENGVFFLSWSYVNGDIKNTTGSWEIKMDDPQKGFTQIRYNVMTDPGRFVPNSITNILSTKSVPDMIKSIRKRAEDFSR